ncbi:hypothetical protein AKJ61_01230 [candidate division MSBL1 archaeon SCGC-AAA259B11]|uniref:Uncharacterized protein n=1 Tax=candidate division MSBL1 archaeon SCGC-AAA259B11 TaxID=1698260 RepID=A0A133U7L3_9EURY|nr:hypothetical protein AKJ61_01230 [candidate division MSBL1 archaeon SCGC-AAA259B11]
MKGERGATIGTAVLIIAIVAAGMGGGLYLIFHYKSTEDEGIVVPEVDIEEGCSIPLWGRQGFKLPQTR